MKRLLVMLAVLSAAVYVGCKQKDGDRCQVNDDCESGQCNMSKGTCTSGTGGGSSDADMPDLVIDGPPDAMADVAGDI